jgi:hypothetical protein
MKKILMATVATLSLAAALPTFAQDTLIGVESEADAEAGAVVGAAGGGATGAVVGGLLGGPIGAVIGGFAGATIGAEAGIEATTVEYATANPVDPIYFDTDVDVGYTVPAEVNVYPIESDPAYGYLYANDRVWLVDMETRQLVQSPGYAVPQTTVDYVMSNPIDPIEAQGDVVVGYVLPDGTEVSTIPDSRFGYVYVDDRPALVDASTRTVIWVN